MDLMRPDLILEYGEGEGIKGKGNARISKFAQSPRSR